MYALTMSLSSCCRRHKTPAHICLSVAYVFLTFLRFSLVLAVLSGNLWVWISLGLGTGTGYFFLRPCLDCTTPMTADECDVSCDDGCVRLKSRGRYTVQKAALRSKDVQQGQGRYSKRTNEYNNNHEDKQTQPLLTATQNAENLTATQNTEKSQAFLTAAQNTEKSQQLLKVKRNRERSRLLTATRIAEMSQQLFTATHNAEKSQPLLTAHNAESSQSAIAATHNAESSQPFLTATRNRETSTLCPKDEYTTFLPHAQPSIQNMSNEERWEYIRQTFQRLSRSRLERSHRQRDQSCVSPDSSSSVTQSHWDSSFDVSTVDIDDLLNEDTYRVQESL